MELLNDVRDGVGFGAGFFAGCAFPGVDFAGLAGGLVALFATGGTLEGLEADAGAGSSSIPSQNLISSFHHASQVQPGRPSLFSQVHACLFFVEQSLIHAIQFINLPDKLCSSRRPHVKDVHA